MRNTLKSNSMLSARVTRAFTKADSNASPKHKNGDEGLSGHRKRSDYY